MNYSENFQNQFYAYTSREGNPAIYTNAPVLLSELMQLDKEFGLGAIVPSTNEEMRIGLQHK
jgi:hypothetical protein